MGDGSPSRWLGYVFFFKQKTAYEIGVRLVGSEMCIRDSPYSGIENVPQDLCMQQYRKLFEFPGAFRHHKRQKAAAVICKCRIVQVCLPEWIIAAGFDVFFDIIVGIHQVDEFSEEESDLTKLSLIHISEPTRRTPISYAVFCLKKKKKRKLVPVIPLRIII